jgi:UDP-glucose 4-epimerase
VRLLITGIHGFIGGGVGRVARGAGHDVLGLDLAAQAPKGWDGAYAQADAAHADVAPLVRDFAPDAVLHAAGTASVGQSYATPLDDLRAAVLTWANVLDGIRRSALTPVVLFPSSAAVYGNPEHLPVAEDAPVRPISPYGFHKAACELVGWEHVECFDMDVVLARLFSVYGPGQRRLLLWELYERAIGPEPEIALLGTGKETRDYLHVDDAARALLAVAAKRPRGLTVVNVASGEAIETGALAALVARAAGVDKPVRARGAERAGDPTHWRADVARLRAFGAQAHRPLEAGVRACVEAWR